MSKTAYPKLHKALRFAVKAHKKQDRDGEHPLPYVSHPIDVLNRLRYDALVVDEDILCVGVLHDLLEETEVTEATILAKFGERVAHLVRELTREEPDEETLKLPEDQVWQIRADMMIIEIDRMSDDAKIIKLADRCSNLHSAFVTKTGVKLERYVVQSRKTLKHIARSVCPPLWDQLQEMAGAGGHSSNGAPKKAQKPKAVPAKPKRPSK